MNNHVGLPIAAAGTINVGNIVYVDDRRFIVTKVGGAAFDMIPIRDGDYPQAAAARGER